MTEKRKPSVPVYGGIAILFLIASAAISWLVVEFRARSMDQAPGTTTYVATDELDARVRNLLRNNPDIIVESLELLEIRERAAENDRRKDTLSERTDELLRDPDSPVGGNPDGDVTLVEFSDYNCPYCRRVAPVLTEAEASDPRLRIVYKEIPILGPNSMFAAKAALAARQQGKYVAFHRALMDAKGVAAEGLVLAIAARVGLNVTRLQSDMESPSIQAAIDRNLSLARAMGINGTPSFIVGNEIVSGALDLKKIRLLIGRARAQR